MTVIGVDTGKRKHAWAEFPRGRLAAVGHGPDVPMIQGAHYAVEIPDRVTGSTLKTILELRDAAMRVRVAAEAIGTVVTYEAHEWKGSMPKPKHHRALWVNVLTEGERRIIARFARRSPVKCFEYIEAACRALALGQEMRYGWAAHNVLDATGLGCFELGRTDKAGNRIE